LDLDYGTIGGFLCGAIAGGGARLGRLCSMSTIEDALVARDYRGAKAWGLAIAVAGLATLAMVGLDLVDLTTSSALAPRLHVLGVIVGGIAFGIGMALVGTCSFGLIVRSGGGDLRALVAAMIVGIFAFAVTAGLLSPLRLALLDVGMVEMPALGQASLQRLLSRLVGADLAHVVVIAGLIALAVVALADTRLLRRPRLIASAVLIGLAVAGGWLATSLAIDQLTATRVDSLSFVAPAGRALLQFMAVPIRDGNFGMAAVIGAGLASFAVAAARSELRWEAFDDPREMRRHLVGAALMGIGGVLAQGGGQCSRDQRADLHRVRALWRAGRTEVSD
jgi:uncharacterized protein